MEQSDRSAPSCVRVACTAVVFAIVHMMAPLVAFAAQIPELNEPIHAGPTIRFSAPPNRLPRAKSAIQTPIGASSSVTDRVGESSIRIANLPESALSKSTNSVLIGSKHESGRQDTNSDTLIDDTIPIERIPAPSQEVLPAPALLPQPNFSPGTAGTPSNLPIEPTTIDGGLPGYEPYSPAQTFEMPMQSTGLGDVVRIDSPFSITMLDFQNRQTDKQLYLIADAASDYPSPQIILGTQLRASMFAASTNRSGKFPYLGRFPTDFVGTTATDARLLHGNLAAASHCGPWIHGYMETLFSDVFTFPDFKQGSFQMRQAYVTLGNLEASPFYAFIGKKTVSFGDMGTLSPFSQSMVWHYFAALAEGIGGGYYRDGLNISATALNGSRGIRVADSPAKGELNNFAVNGSYTFSPLDGVLVQAGAGYLGGTIYDANIAEHTNPNVFGKRNPAYDVNLQLRVGRFQVAGEIAQTTKVWPLTKEKITAYRTELGFDGRFFRVPTSYSASWSEGIQGAEGTQFQFNRQLVAGLGMQIHPNALLTLEYVHSSGFAPLINLTTVSDRSVHQHSAVIGLVLAL